MGERPEPAPHVVPDPGSEGQDDLIARVARGDDAAFARLYDVLSPAVYGLVRKVLRDPAQAEEVAQEVFVEIWRTATQYDRSKSSVNTWALTIGHRRAVDRVRAEQASSDREHRAAAGGVSGDYDFVAEQVTAKLEHEQVRRCLDSLTELQRESVALAYYAGHTYREVAELLETNLATVKTRMRDGLVRLRDCLGVRSEAP